MGHRLLAARDSSRVELETKREGQRMDNQAVEAFSVEHYLFIRIGD